jgi:hypothetical protein
MTGVAARTHHPDETVEAAAGLPADQDATRYLCTAAHLDPGFTRQVVRELLVAEHRLPLPVPSVDLATVVRHAIAARSRRLYRDAAMLVILAVTAAVAGWAVGVWYVWSAGLWLALRAARQGSARHAAVFGAVLWGFAALIVLALAATDTDPLGLRGAWRIPPPTAAETAVWVGAPAVAALACWLAVFAEEIAARATIAERLRRERFTPTSWLSAEPAWAQHALGVLGERLADGRLEHHPVVDPANPFVGAGPQVLRRRWLIELGPAAGRSAPFDTADLLDRICERLTDGLDALDSADLTRDPAAAVVDECAISTADALATRDGRDSVRLLPDAPALGGQGGGPRPFRRIRVGADPAGLIVTVFLNATAGAGLLQVELYGHVLGPIAARYRAADSASSFNPASAFGCAVRAAKRLPHAVFTAPRGLLRTTADPVLRRRHRAALARAAAGGLTVQAGARFSAREAVAARAGADRFADEDANLYLAVVERRVREELRPLLPAAAAEF